MSERQRTTRIKASHGAQLTLQQRIYSYMKHKAQSFEGPISKDFRAYRTNQEKFSTRSFKLSSLKELVSSIERSHIVYLGDFHTFDQSSKNLQRLLKILMKHKHKLSLGVEFVDQEHQLAVDQFLAGLLTEGEFLEVIDYKESWRFPWTYYQVFFQLAREHQIEIIALNSAGTLKQRDNKAAEMISTYLHGKKDSIMLVLFGEYHIVPNKLPALVKKKMSKDLRQTIIHQNLDAAYWRLQKLASKTPIIRFSDFEFSLQTSPPWIKYESMIYWYENLIEDPGFDIHQYMLETGFIAFNSSVPDTFYYLACSIAESLGVKKIDELDDFNIYDHQKLSLIEKKVDRLKSKQLNLLHRHFLNKGKKFKLPFENIYYASSYSINRISYLAGIHLFDALARESNPQYESVWLKSSPTEKFIFLTFRFTLGHLASKIINPYMKCDLYQDIVHALYSPKVPSLKKGNYRIVKQLLDETEKATINLSPILKGKGLITLYYCAESVGHIFGDRLYEEYFKKKKKAPKKLLGAFTSTDFSQENFQYLLQALLPKGSYKELRKRLF
jgi:hypothetical protein